MCMIVINFMNPVIFYHRPMGYLMYKLYTHFSKKISKLMRPSKSALFKHFCTCLIVTFLPLEITGQH